MQKTRKLRLLLAIASFGTKNLSYLKAMISRYQGMQMEVDVVVLSEGPKDLGKEVEVVVGLPARNPWSLPFAHKPLFAQRVGQYDLFAYSEDDMEVTEENIEAFLRITPLLAPDEIAGYLRYEIGQGGEWVLTDVHGGYHWKPESVKGRGPYTVAEFTNEHAAFYLLTQAQLRQAIASGGFLREPYEGRHDMLCAAATDPYTSCGFRKVICISELKSFLIRHMSNLYVGRHGVGLGAFEEQAQTLMRIRDGLHPATTLCATETRMRRLQWSKGYYEEADGLLGFVPKQAKTVLSVGCGWGALEGDLQAEGKAVTALALDSVIGACAARHGMEIIYGTLGECFQQLGERRFDCIMVSDLAHLQREPAEFLKQCSRFVGGGGSMVIKGPNFERLPVRLKRVIGRTEYGKLKEFDQSGVAVCVPSNLARQAKREGFTSATIQWINHIPLSKVSYLARLHMGAATAADWVLQLGGYTGEAQVQKDSDAAVTAHGR